MWHFVAGVAAGGRKDNLRFFFSRNRNKVSGATAARRVDKKSRGKKNILSFREGLVQYPIIKTGYECALP